LCWRYSYICNLIFHIVWLFIFILMIICMNRTKTFTLYKVGFDYGACFITEDIKSIMITNRITLLERLFILVYRKGFLNQLWLCVSTLYYSVILLSWLPRCGSNIKKVILITYNINITLVWYFYHSYILVLQSVI
jgi:hypothetical protein